MVAVVVRGGGPGEGWITPIPVENPRLVPLLLTGDLSDDVRAVPSGSVWPQVELTVPPMRWACLDWEPPAGPDETARTAGRNGP